MIGSRHQLRRVVARIAEHHALVPCANHAVGSIDTLTDVGRLAVKFEPDLAAVGIDAGERAVISDSPNDPADKIWDLLLHVFVETGEGVDFAGDHHEVMSDQAFGSDLGLGDHRSGSGRGCCRRWLPRPVDDSHQELFYSDPLYMVWGSRI